MMIESVEFKNFKALRNAKLPLSQFTLIVGPNGSGKSTAMQALKSISILKDAESVRSIMTAGVDPRVNHVAVTINWGEPFVGIQTLKTFGRIRKHNGQLAGQTAYDLDRALQAIHIYSFDAQAIATPTVLDPGIRLDSNGANLASVLDRLRDIAPERFDALKEEFGRWLPEYDRILFDTPRAGHRAILLRTREGHHRIPASDLSQGTLLALALLTLAYLPDPPPIVCIEEPDRGIHPRLLRNVQDALYRLSYPESGRETRAPIQVIATTHSPYMLDLYRDHPEEIVIAQKTGQEVHFERLSDRSDINEILEDAHLGDIWYSGILGGVPSHP